MHWYLKWSLQTHGQCNLNKEMDMFEMQFVDKSQVCQYSCNGFHSKISKTIHSENHPEDYFQQ